MNTAIGALLVLGGIVLGALGTRHEKPRRALEITDWPAPTELPAIRLRTPFYDQEQEGA